MRPHPAYIDGYGEHQWSLPMHALAIVGLRSAPPGCPKAAKRQSGRPASTQSPLWLVPSIWRPGPASMVLGPSQTTVLCRDLLTLLDATSAAPRLTRISGVVANDCLYKAPAVEPWLASRRAFLYSGSQPLVRGPTPWSGPAAMCTIRVRATTSGRASTRWGTLSSTIAARTDRGATNSRRHAGAPGATESGPALASGPGRGPTDLGW